MCSSFLRRLFLLPFNVELIHNAIIFDVIVFPEHFFIHFFDKKWISISFYQVLSEEPSFQSLLNQKVIIRVVFQKMCEKIYEFPHTLIVHFVFW